MIALPQVRALDAPSQPPQPLLGALPNAIYQTRSPLKGLVTLAAYKLHCAGPRQKAREARGLAYPGHGVAQGVNPIRHGIDATVLRGRLPGLGHASPWEGRER
jgi:hypothetical protein